MCVFLSWLHYKGKDLFIDDDIMSSKKGAKLKKHLAPYYWEDITGHGAIVKLHKLGGYTGDHIEVASFKEIIRFPIPILESIDECKFKKVGMPAYVIDMLNPDISKTYIEQKIKETKVYDDIKNKIVDKNSKAIEALRTIDRVYYAKTQKIYADTCYEAYKKRSKALEELLTSYTGPMSICDERKAYLKKEQDIRNKFSCIEIEASKLKKEENKKNDSKNEVNILMKKNTFDTKKLHYDYKKKLVNRFWNLFEDQKNRNATWKGLSKFLGG